MKLGKVYLLSTLVFLIFFAGCTKESVVTGGVEIEKFASQVSTVASNSPVEFTVIVKNTGEREATDVKAVLGGLTFLTADKLKPASSLSEEDQYKLWRPESWRVDNKVPFTEFLKPLDSPDPPSLEGEDAQSGFKGEQGIVTWRLISPVQARDQTYEPTVNLVYGYSAISTILIKAVDFNYLQSLPESEQKSISTGVTVSKTTKGPIEVSVKTDQAIISGFSTLPIEIEFKNVGGGRTFVGEIKEDPSMLYQTIRDGLDKFLVELPSDIQKCNLNPKTVTETTKIYEIRLVEGKNGRILCHKAIGGISTIQTISIDIKTEYKYLIEGKTTVKVSKTLYQPPIVDISLKRSDISLVFDMQGTTDAGDDVIRAKLNLVVRSEGNQDLNGDVDVTYSTKIDDIEFSALTGTKKVTMTKLTPFSNVEQEIEPKTISPNKKSLVTTVSAPALELSALPKETNEANNEHEIKKSLEPKIEIQLTARPSVNQNTLDVTIPIKITNANKDLVLQSIPLVIDVGEVGAEIACEYKKTKLENNVIDKLGIIDIESSKDVNCIYENTNDRLKFDIKAEVAGYVTTSLEKDFEIKYDLAVEKSHISKIKIDNENVIYTILTTVTNKGTIQAENYKVEFYIDNEATPKCTKDVEEKLDPAKSKSVTCDITIPITQKFTASAKVVGLPTEPDTLNNVEEIKIDYDIRLVDRRPMVVESITEGTIYTISAKIELTDTVNDIQIEGLNVDFLKGDNSLCKEKPSSFSLLVGIPFPISCKSIPITEAIIAKAVATTLATENNINNNDKKFEISVISDLAIEDSKSEFVKFDNEGNTIYDFITSVKNLGTVTIKADDFSISFIKVVGTEENGLLTIAECRITDSEGKSREGALNDGKTKVAIPFDITPEDFVKVSCRHATKEVETQAKASVEIGIKSGITDSEIDNNKDDPFKISIIYDVAILKDSSKFQVKSIVGDQVTYTLSTQVKNEGNVLAESIKVGFVNKATDKSLCKSEIPLFNLRPGEVSPVKSCESTLSVVDSIEVIAKIVVTPPDSDATDNEELFQILPRVSLGTAIISPADNTWQGTDKIAIQVKDVGEVSDCKVTVIDENVKIKDNAERECNEDVTINLKSRCPSGEQCCSIEGEGKCKVTLSSKTPDGKTSTASRTFNIDLKPSTITSFVIKDRVSSSTEVTNSRIVAIDLSAKDESTSAVRNTASGIDKCRFTELFTRTTLKRTDWVPCASKFFKLVAYTNKDVFDYWTLNRDMFTPSIKVEVRDRAGNVADITKEIRIDPLVEVVSIDDVGSGIKGGYCGEVTIEDDRLKEPSCTFDKMTYKVDDFSKITVNFKTDQPAECGIIDRSIPLIDDGLKGYMDSLDSGTVDEKFVKHANFFKCSSADDLKVYDPLPKILCDVDYWEPLKHIYIVCKDQFGVKPTKIAQTYHVGITLKDITPPVTNIASVGRTSIISTDPPPNVILDDSKTAKIVVTGNERMTCRWEERSNRAEYSEDRGQPCEGSGTTSAICKTTVSTDSGNFVRGKTYSMNAACKDSEGNGQTAIATEFIEFVVEDFP